MLSKPTTWAQNFASTDVSDTLNRRTQQIFAAFSQEDPAGLHRICTENKGLSILTLATGLNCSLTILHHLDSAGSVLQGTERVKIALLGEDDKAAPQELDIDVLFSEEQVACPRATYINNLQSPEDIERPLPRDGSVPSDVITVNRSILLPPWAFHAIEQADAFTPMRAFIAVIETARSLDTVRAERPADEPAAAQANDADDQNEAQEGAAADDDAAADEPSFVTQAFFCLQTLWRWSQTTNPTNGLVEPVIVESAILPTRRQDITRWATNLHENCLQPRHPRLQLNHADNSSSNALRTVTADLASAATALERSTLKDAENRSAQQLGFGRLPEATQKMLLRAMATGHQAFPSSASKQASEFFKQRTAAQAFQYVKDVYSEKRLRCEPSQGLISAVHQGLFISRQAGIPGNFTPFGLPKSFARLKMHSAEEDVASALRVSEGKGSSETDIDRQTKQHLHFPENLEDAKHQLANTIGFLEILAPPPPDDEDADPNTPLLITQLTSLYRHMEDNPTTYEELDAARPTFLTEVTYLYGDAIQTFLQACREGFVNPEVICFNMTKSSIRQRIFRLQLPQDVLQKFHRQHPRGIRNDRSNPKSEPGGHPGKVQTELATNQWHEETKDKDYKLRDGENYARLCTDALHAKIVKAPEWADGVQSCAKFHVTGTCVAHCNRPHEKLNATQEKEMSRFMQDCREASATGNVPVSKKRRRFQRNRRRSDF